MKRKQSKPNPEESSKISEVEEDTQNKVKQDQASSCSVMRIIGYLCLITCIVGGLFGIDRYMNPYEELSVSKYRYNWAFERKYKQIGELGTGAMGIVVKVVRRDDPNGEQYAAKLSRHGFYKQQSEIDMLKFLDHPRITRLIDSFYGSYFESTVMVLNLVKGKTLAAEHEAIRKEPGNNGFMPRETAIDWIKQMTEILMYVHSKKVIHRDIHFGNWMIADKQIYLLDLGIAMYLENGIVELSNEKYWWFFPWFSAPEVNFHKPHTFNADTFIMGYEVSMFNKEAGNQGPISKIVWSKKKAGVTVEDEVVGGKLQEGAVKEIYDALIEEYKTPRFERYGPEFEKVFLSMLAYDPKDRPSSAELNRMVKELK